MTGNVAAPPRVNVLDPAFYVEPWAAYRWLRDEAPVFWDPIQRLWAISRYDDVLFLNWQALRLQGLTRFLTSRSDSAVRPSSGHSPVMMLSMIP